MDGGIQIALLIAVILALGLAFFCALSLLLLGRHWLRAFLFGVPVSLLEILGARLRGNPPALLVDAYIALKHGGADVTFRDVENAYFDARTRIVTSNELVDVVNQRKLAK